MSDKTVGKPVPDAERDAFGITEFCARHGICRSTFYKILAEGEGPRTFKVGQRTMVSREAVADWHAAREAATLNSARKVAVRA